MTDKWGPKQALGAPSYNAFAVVPNDGVDLVDVPQQLFIGGAGNLSVITHAGNPVTLTGVAAGTILPLRVTRVNATGTTATNIVALS